MSHIAFPFFRSFLISFSYLPPFAFCFLFNRGNIGPTRSIGIIFFFFFSFPVSCSYSLERLCVIGGLENSYLFLFVSLFSVRWNHGWNFLPPLSFVSPFSIEFLDSRLAFFFEISWVISEFRIRSLVWDLDNFLEIIFRIFKSVRLIRIIIFLRSPFFFQ